MFWIDDRVRHVSPNARDGGLGEGTVVDISEGTITVAFDRVDAKGRSNVGVYPPTWFQSSAARLEKVESNRRLVEPKDDLASTE